MHDVARSVQIAALCGKQSAMPELPEVEMVARHLRSLIAGRTITKAKLLRAKLAPENTPRQFATNKMANTAGKAAPGPSHKPVPITPATSVVTIISD